MTSTEKIWLSVRSNEQVKAALNTCLTGFVAVHDYRLGLTKKSLLPGEAKREIERLEKEDLTGLNADQLVERSDKLSALRRLHENPSVQNEAKRNLVAKLFAQRPSIQALLTVVNAALDAQHAERIEAEKEFFAGFDLEREETSASRSLLETKSAFNAKFTPFSFPALDACEKQPTGAFFPFYELDMFSDLLGGEDAAELHPALKGHVDKLMASINARQTQ